MRNPSKIVGELFLELYESLPEKGWLTFDEAQLLYDWAFQSKGPILEVGCYHGRSTVLLLALGRKVHAVDPFEGFDDSDPSGNATYESFAEAIVDRGLERQVRLWRCWIEDWEPVKCGFAYLDGDHTYQGTLDQIDKALACGVRRVAIHDVNDSGGGLEVKRAAVERLGAWSDRVGRLAVWEVRR